MENPFWTTDFYFIHSLMYCSVFCLVAWVGTRDPLWHKHLSKLNLAKAVRLYFPSLLNVNTNTEKVGLFGKFIFSFFQLNDLFESQREDGFTFCEYENFWYSGRFWVFKIYILSFFYKLKKIINSNINMQKIWTKYNTEWDIFSKQGREILLLRIHSRKRKISDWQFQLLRIKRVSHLDFISINLCLH